MTQLIVDFLSEFLGTFILVYVVFKTSNYLAIGLSNSGVNYYLIRLLFMM